MSVCEQVKLESMQFINGIIHVAISNGTQYTIKASWSLCNPSKRVNHKVQLEPMQSMKHRIRNYNRNKCTRGSWELTQSTNQYNRIYKID